MQEQSKDNLNINDQMLYKIAHNIAIVPLILEELEATLLHLLPTLPYVFEIREDLKTLLDKYKLKSCIQHVHWQRGRIHIETTIRI
jgi:hypothetical protein